MGKLQNAKIQRIANFFLNHKSRVWTEHTEKSMQLMCHQSWTLQRLDSFSIGVSKMPMNCGFWTAIQQKLSQYQIVQLLASIESHQKVYKKSVNSSVQFNRIGILFIFHELTVHSTLRLLLWVKSILEADRRRRSQHFFVEELL